MGSSTGAPFPIRKIPPIRLSEPPVYFHDPKRILHKAGLPRNPDPPCTGAAAGTRLASQCAETCVSDVAEVARLPGESTTAPRIARILANSATRHAIRVRQLYCRSHWPRSCTAHDAQQDVLATQLSSTPALVRQLHCRTNLPCCDCGAKAECSSTAHLVGSAVQLRTCLGCSRQELHAAEVAEVGRTPGVGQLAKLPARLSRAF